MTAAEIATLFEDAMAAAVLQATIEGYSTDEVNAAEIHARILGAYGTAYSSVFGAPPGSVGSVAVLATVVAVGKADKVAVGSTVGTSVIAGVGTDAHIGAAAVVGSSSVAAVGTATKVAAVSAVGSAVVTAVGASQRIGVGSVVGTSATTGQITGLALRIATAVGSSVVTAVGVTQKVAVGAAAGSATVLGESSTFARSILDGIVSAQSEAGGWDALKASIPTSAVVRTSDTEVTITLPTLAPYFITANELLTVTLPPSVLTGGVAIVASPTIPVTDLSAPAGAAVGTSVVTGAGTSKRVGVGNAIGSSSVTSVATSSVGQSFGSSVVTAAGVAKRVGVGTAVGSATVLGGSPSSGSNAYFDSLIIRPDSLKRYSGRPQSGVGKGSGDGANAHYGNQLLHDSAFGGYAESAPPYDIIYNPAGDLDPDAQDAAKVSVPCFFAGGTLIGAMNSSQTTLDTTSGHQGYSDVSRNIKVDSEIMRVTVARSGTTVGIARAQHGTAAASHSAGAAMFVSGNSIANNVQFPLNLTGGNTYLLTWDAYLTSSAMRITTLTSQKTYNIRDSNSGYPGAIWWETRYRWAGGEGLDGGSGPQPGYDALIHASAHDVRSYAPDSGALGPVTPQLAAALIKPLKWHRFWVLFTHNGASPTQSFVDQWFATEESGPTQILSNQVAYVRGGTIVSFEMEFNSSFEDFKGGPDEPVVIYWKNLSVHINPNMGSFPMPRPVP